jgi:hypothetical protein
MIAFSEYQAWLASPTSTRIRSHDLGFPAVGNGASRVEIHPHTRDTSAVFEVTFSHSLCLRPSPWRDPSRLGPRRHPQGRGPRGS